LTNEVFAGNMVISKTSVPSLNTNLNGTCLGYAYCQSSDPRDSFSIANNAYFNYGGGSIFSNGTVQNDTSPTKVNPRIGGHTYSIASGSPVFRPPVSFPRVIGGWGPPGFVIPMSTNHSNP
jgi:hypothetical protein